MASDTQVVNLATASAPEYLFRFTWTDGQVDDVLAEDQWAAQNEVHWLRYGQFGTTGEAQAELEHLLIMDAPKPGDPVMVRTAEDVDAAIRATWQEVCRDFPNATTPSVAKRVAQGYSISVERVFGAFPSTRKETN